MKMTIAPSATPLEQTARVQLTQPKSKSMKNCLERQKNGKRKGARHKAQQIIQPVGITTLYLTRIERLQNRVTYIKLKNL